MARSKPISYIAAYAIICLAANATALAAPTTAPSSNENITTETPLIKNGMGSLPGENLNLKGNDNLAEPEPQPDTNSTIDNEYEQTEPDWADGESDFLEIPAITTVELSMELARRAIDALAEVRDRYNDKGIDDYETLEEFVANTNAGKKLLMDLKKFQFQDVGQWSTAIASVGFAYGALVEGQDTAIQSQIDKIKQDESIPDSKKHDLVERLSAMLPSSNNKNIVADLLHNPVYKEKLKLLE